MPNRILVAKDRPWFRCWPRLLPKSLDYPEIPLFETLEVTAKRYPNKTAIIYYGRTIPYEALWESSLRLATSLKDMGIRKGDRVAVHLPNTPHAVIAYYGILRANAVVVAMDPMASVDGLKALLADSGCRVMVTLTSALQKIRGIQEDTPLEQVIACRYRDYLPEKPALPVPSSLLMPEPVDPSVRNWQDILNDRMDPPAIEVGPDDPALIMYTSGTTGERKGALHTHWNLIVNTLRAAAWNYNYPSSMHLAVLPLFHITGMHYCMTAPVYTGGTMVLLSRWDREAALQAIETYACTHFSNITTIVVDLLAIPHIEKRNLSSLIVFGGGGAAVPDAIGDRLAAMGLLYTEGYGLTEAGSGTHVNPRDRISIKCMGIPLFDIDSRIIDPETLQEMPVGQSGELIMRTPSMFREFWNKPEETAKAFVEIDGKRWLRTGDIVRMDGDGNHYFVDRLKRLVNRAGLKVWPAAIEGDYYKHPAIQEACIIGTADERVGEEVKVCVVLREDCREAVTEAEILAWGKERFAAHEYPRIVEFVQELPKNASGKIQWRILQERENAGGRDR